MGRTAFPAGRVWAALAATSLLGGCATGPRVPPDVAARDDVCAVLNLPGSPGEDEAAPGSEACTAPIEQALREHGETYFIEGRGVKSHGAWGRCPTGHGTTDTITMTPDRMLAAKEGGWQAAPLAGGYGICFYEKVELKWRLAGCRITLVS